MPQDLSETMLATPIAPVSATPATRTMRKGTHSCIECRRRKIRCNWPKNSDKCNFCSTRQQECIEQVLGDVRVLALRKKQKKKSARERTDDLARSVTEALERLDSTEWPEELPLEALRNLQRELRELPRRRRDTDTALSFRDRAGTAGGDSEDENSGLSNAPLLSLFDNFLFSNEENNLEESPASASFKTRRRRIKEINTPIVASLRVLIPGRPALILVLKANRVSLCLLQKSFPELPGLKSYLNDEQIEVLIDHILTVCASEDIAAVTKVAVCLATCFQQLPHDFDLGLESLPAPLHILQQYYLDFTETLLSPDEGIVSSFTGIRCLLVQVRYFLNLGLPTKAWIICQRALTLAQCLGGFQKSSNDRLNSENRALQIQLQNLDRTLSLLFGFPCATSHLQLGTAPITSTLPPRMILFHKLGEVMTQIIDRNQQHDNISFSESVVIDLELEKCRQIMPASWWGATAEDNMPQEDIYEMFTVKLFFYSLRNLIYLPFFTKALASCESRATVVAGLTASRELVRCYGVLRDAERAVLRMCNLIDFQGTHGEQKHFIFKIVSGTMTPEMCPARVLHILSQRSNY